MSPETATHRCAPRARRSSASAPRWRRMRPHSAARAPGPARPSQLRFHGSNEVQIDDAEHPRVGSIADLQADFADWIAFRCESRETDTGFDVPAAATHIVATLHRPRIGKREQLTFGGRAVVFGIRLATDLDGPVGIEPRPGLAELQGRKPAQRTRTKALFAYGQLKRGALRREVQVVFGAPSVCEGEGELELVSVFNLEESILHPAS